MPGLNLRALLGQKTASMDVVRKLCESLDADLCVVDPTGKIFLGELPNGAYDSGFHYPIVSGEANLGSVVGSGTTSLAMADGPFASCRPRVATARACFRDPHALP